MKFLIRNFLLIVVIFLIVSSLFTFLFQSFAPKTQVSLNQLVQDINQDKVKSITAFGSNLNIVYNDNHQATAMKEPETGLRETLIAYGANQDKQNRSCHHICWGMLQCLNF